MATMYLTMAFAPQGARPRVAFPQSMPQACIVGALPTGDGIAESFAAQGFERLGEVRWCFRMERWPAALTLGASRRGGEGDGFRSIFRWSGFRKPIRTNSSVDVGANP